MIGEEMYCLKPGMILDHKYKIIRVIGIGGFGITYEAINERVNRNVAIKEFYCRDLVYRDVNASHNVVCTEMKTIESFQKAKSRFLDEARVIGVLSNEEGIVKVIDYFEENETAYIVMDYINGITLDEQMNIHGRYSDKEMVELLRPLMVTLQKVHEKGIIHRDISPDNIRVNSKGRLELLDFGAAKEYMAKQQNTISVVLKQGYAPVEQYGEGEKQGPWTDVYSLCALMYRGITGQVPVSSVSRMLYDELKMPSEMGIQINSDFEKIIKKGLSVSYEDRYQSVEELLTAFDEVYPSEIPDSISDKKYSQPDSGNVNEEAKQKKEHKFIHRKKLFISAGIAAILCIICLAVFLGSKEVFVEKKLSNNIEYDAETMYKVRLDASDLTVKDFQKSAKIIQERLEFYLDGEAYSAVLDEMGMDLILPKKVFETQYLGVADVLKAYITRRTQLCVAYGNTRADRIDIPREMIESVSIEHGKIDGFTKNQLKTENYTESQEYDYLQIVVKDDLAEEIKTTFEDIDMQNELRLGQDYDSDLSNYISCPMAISENGKTLYAINSDLDGLGLKMMQYNYTHEVSPENMEVLVIIDANWETPEDTEYWGENQCTAEEIQSEYVTAVYTGTSEYTAGEQLDLETAMKERLDSLNIPYLFAKDENSNGTVNIYVRASNEYIDESILDLLCNSYSECKVSNDNEYFSIGMLMKIENMDTGNYRIRLTPKYNHQWEESLPIMEKWIEDADAATDPEVMIDIAEALIGRINLTESIEQNCVIIDQVKNQGEWIDLTESNIWYPEFLKTVIDTENRIFYLHLNEYQDEIGEKESEEKSGQDQSALVDSENIEREFILYTDSTIIEKYQSVFDEIDSSAKLYMDGRELIMKCSWDVNEELPQRVVDSVKSIIQNLDFEQNTLTSVNCYFIDEDNSIMERARIFIRKNYDNVLSEYDDEKSEYELSGIFANGRVDEYKTQIRQAIDEDEILSEIDYEDL